MALEGARGVIPVGGKAASVWTTHRARAAELLNVAPRDPEVVTLHLQNKQGAVIFRQTPLEQ